jgi:hypothetical protein
MSGAGTDLTQMRNRDGSIMHGRKADFSKLAKQVVENHRDLVLSEMFTDANAREFIRVTVEGMKRGDRTQYIAYKEMAKLADVEVKHVVEFIHSTGARSEDEIRRAVQTMQSAEGASTLDTISRLTEALAALLNIEPTQRDFVVRQLGGLVPVPERMG